MLSTRRSSSARGARGRHRARLHGARSRPEDDSSPEGEWCGASRPRSRPRTTVTCFVVRSAQEASGSPTRSPASAGTFARDAPVSEKNDDASTTSKMRPTRLRNEEKRPNSRCIRGVPDLARGPAERATSNAAKLGPPFFSASGDGPSCAFDSWFPLLPRPCSPRSSPPPQRSPRGAVT